MAGQFGIKDAGDIQLINRATGNVDLFINYANTFEIAITSTSVSANAKGVKAITWDGQREGTVTIGVQLATVEMFALIFGSKILKDNFPAYKREKFTITGAGQTVELAETPMTDSVTAFTLQTDEATHKAQLSPVVSGKDVTLTGAVVGDVVSVYYTTEIVGATSFKIKGTKEVSSDYTLVCVTVTKERASGAGQGIQVILPKVSPQANATISFDAENPSSFDIVLDIMVDENDDMLIWGDTSV